MTFFLFSHRPEISNFPPIFPVSVYFPPLSRKLLFPPYFDKCSPLFYTNSPAFYILYMYFVSPYFYHDAFMHHPTHVLDAPGYGIYFDVTLFCSLQHHNLTRLQQTLHVFRFPPTFTMMHLCITQCTYWTSLATVYMLMTLYFVL